ncbi:hypothetical protein [Chitinophaga deserti]|uniref:hypothetical protein n=1 Tax=Chitinophaga deserti TaxID=2164099 RepID=UPI000D6B38DA|nr:hypothetical protein [Chitinophaga deserti]
MKLSFSLCSITASLFFATLLSWHDAQAQAKLGGNPVVTRGDAILELESSRKGLLLPRVTSMALTAKPLDTASQGMMVYNLTENKVYIRSNGAWKAMRDTDSDGWQTTGNLSINPAIHYLGTNNAQPLIFKTNGTEAARIAADRKIGINTTLPHSHLHVNGSTATNVVVGTGNFTMADTNSVVIMNNTTAANFVLQNPATYKGRAIEVVAYGTANVNFTAYTVRGQNSASPTLSIAPGYSLRLVSNGAEWIITGKQRSGLPMYYATTLGAGEGEVIRDYNGYLSQGSGVFQTDVLGAPTNPIPNEGAWFSMMLQTVGGGYFGQFNLNDHNAYFRGNSMANLPVAEWQKFISHPATIQFGGQMIGTDSLNFNMINNRNLVFSTNNVARLRLHGDGNISAHGPVTIDGTLRGTSTATFEKDAAVKDSMRVEGRLRMQGMVIANIKSITGAYTILANDYTISGISDAAFTLTLTTGVNQIGRIIIFKVRRATVGIARTYTVNASGGTIDGAASVTLSATETGAFCMLQQATATNWIVISK